MARKKSASRNVASSEKVTSDRFFPDTLLNNVKYNINSLCMEHLIPSAVFISQNALTTKECENWIRYAEASSWDTVAHPATKWIAHRECSRLQKNDWIMAHRLFTRIQEIVVEASNQLEIFDKSTLVNTSHASKTYKPITCNPNLRLYKYTKGQWFGKHIDDTNKIEWKDVDAPYPSTAVSGAQTEITVLFYLSSCRGGATRFYLPKSTKKKGNKMRNENDCSVAFSPTQGAVLLHVHGDRCLEHEAEPVLDGVKYVLRTDIVYGIM